MRLLKRQSDGNVSFTKFLSESELAPVRYAILSHTWSTAGGEEVTHNDIVHGTGQNKIGYEKIRFCARRTRQDDLEYFWLDTCCIDRTNEAELSRSLISMFRWYANADKCYVFLTDVPRSQQVESDRTDLEQDLRSSRWFGRGWTLQELLAPSVVEFFSKDGESLGTKASFEGLISQVANIPVEVLRSRSFAGFTLHERRQWMQARETREPEDLIYSLLGLLGVSMPILYGEGLARARGRLHNAISIAQNGTRHENFSLTFDLVKAVETERFIAREDELQSIRANLGSHGSRKVVVLHGIGGIGKTQLALEYALRHKDEYSAILWVNAKDDNTVRLSYDVIAKRLFREHPTATRQTESLDESVGAVKVWLSLLMNTRWLMIFDGYNSPKVLGNDDPTAFDISEILPDAYQGCIIITTRSSQVKTGRCFQIDKLRNLQDNLKILENTSYRDSLTNDRDALQLAQKLDGLPIALTAAGTYLRRTTITVREYIDLFDDSWANLRKLSTGQAMTYEDRILYSIWQISFDQVGRTNGLSTNILRLWAYLDHQDLWFELLADGFSERLRWLQDTAEGRHDFHASVQVLCDYGLAHADAAHVVNSGSEGYSMHACVHSWAQTVLNIEWSQELGRAAWDCVVSHIPEQSELSSTLVQRRLLTHAAKCCRHVEKFDSGVGFTRDLRKLGLLFKGQGQYRLAEQMNRRLVDVRRSTLGVEHPDTLTSMADLASTYWIQGRWREAEELQAKAMEISKSVLGAEHPNTLTRINELASTYQYDLRWAQAAELYEKAVDSAIRVLGAEHPDTLSSTASLAMTYVTQARYSEAQELGLRTLRARRKVLGAEHPDTLTSTANLAFTYRCQALWKETEELEARSLDISTRLRGGEHPVTLGLMQSLAWTYFHLSRCTEAEELTGKVIRCSGRVLGGTHPQTQGAKASLAKMRRLRAANARVAEGDDAFEGTIRVGRTGGA